MPDGWRAAIVLAAVCAFVLKIMLALNTYGTNDVFRWELFILWARYLGSGIYAAVWDFNHPPFTIHATRFLDWIAGKSGISFAFWFRLPAILADAGSLVILWRIAAGRFNEPSVRWSLLFIALSPALVLISGFHGNTDSVVIFFVLLTILLTQRGASDHAAGAAFGMAMCVKVFPVIVLPVMLFYRRDNRERLSFLAGMTVVMAIAWAPFFYEAPVEVIRKTFGYGSYYGHWGISYFTSTQPALAFLNSGFKAYGAWLLAASIAAASYWMNRWSRRPALFSQVAIVFLVFLSGANGFGVQYLAWLVPFTVLAGAIPAAGFMIASGAFLVLVYNYWSQGVPWYLADSNRVGDYQPHLDYFQVACWLSVLLLLFSVWRYIRTGVVWEQFFVRRFPATSVAFGVLFAALLIVPMYRQWHRDTGTLEPLRADALVPLRSAGYRNLAVLLERTGRSDDAQRVRAESGALSR